VRVCVRACVRVCVCVCVCVRPPPSFVNVIYSRVSVDTSCTSGFMNYVMLALAHKGA